MKKIALTCFFGLLTSPALFAQSCSTPTNLQSGTAIGDTCTGANLVSGLECGFTTYTGKQVAFSFTPTAGFTATAITLTNSSANGTWKPQMFLQTGGTCGDSNDCNGGSVTAADANLGTTTTLTFGAGGSTAPVAGSTYFLIVQAANGAQCGQFGLTTTGTFPVKLQSFDIK